MSTRAQRLIARQMHRDGTGDAQEVNSDLGRINYPIALLEAHELEPIDKQGKLTQQDWRTLAHVLVKRAKEYARSFTKVDAADMHHILQMAGIAYDKAYKGSVDTGKGPAHVLIQLFGASGVGESIARNLTAMVPTQRIDDAEVVEAEGHSDVTGTPPPTPSQ